MSAAAKEALALFQAAERDRIAFGILAAAPEAPVENLCFLAQQYLEKLLKVSLALAGMEVRRTHDLGVLARRLIASGHDLPLSLAELEKLVPCAVLARYEALSPGDISRTELLALVAQAASWAQSRPFPSP